MFQHSLKNRLLSTQVIWLFIYAVLACSYSFHDTGEEISVLSLNSDQTLTSELEEDQNSHSNLVSDFFFGHVEVLDHLIYSLVSIHWCKNDGYRMKFADVFSGQSPPLSPGLIY